MDPIIKPIKLGSLRKIDSRKIVNAFLQQPDPAVEVIVDSTGRDFQNVYVALNLWVKRNPDVGVEVHMNKGRIILSRVNTDGTTAKDPSAVH